MSTQPKNFLIPFTENVMKYAPCDAEHARIEKTIKAHPNVTVIRNKRKRARLVRKFHRMGVRFYLAPMWKITPKATDEH